MVCIWWRSCMQSQAHCEENWGVCCEVRIWKDLYMEFPNLRLKFVTHKLVSESLKPWARSFGHFLSCERERGLFSSVSPDCVQHHQLLQRVLWITTPHHPKISILCRSSWCCSSGNLGKKMSKSSCDGFSKLYNVVKLHNRALALKTLRIYEELSQQHAIIQS